MDDARLRLQRSKEAARRSQDANNWDEEEEQPKWRIEGHEWIGKTVVRMFGNERVAATCTKWADEDLVGPAIWLVVSDPYASI